MTRDEFVNDISSWYEYISFCNEHGYEDWVEDIYYGDSLEEILLENIHEWRESINELYIVLDNLPYIYSDSVYYYGGIDDVRDVDNEFEAYKHDLLDRLDEDGFFDEEESEDEREPEVDMSPIDFSAPETSFEDMVSAIDKINDEVFNPIVSRAEQERARECDRLSKLREQAIAEEEAEESLRREREAEEERARAEIVSHAISMLLASA